MICTFALAGTVCFIFSTSLETGSLSSLSSGRVRDFLQAVLIRLGHPGLAQRLTMHLVRKLAHFCEYALEGFVLMLCTRVYTRHFVRHISWPLLGALLTALADETIQLFTYGRSGQITDVWLDFAGAVSGLLVGLCLLGLCHACARAWQHRNGG